VIPIAVFFAVLRASVVLLFGFGFAVTVLSGIGVVVWV
jgi:hypothetical protein